MKKYAPALIVSYVLFAFYAQFDYQAGTWQGYLDLAQGGYYGYPMPGIIGLIKIGGWLGSVSLFMLLLSAPAYGATIYLFYRVFDLEPEVWHLPFFIPLAAIMSVETNHALMPFLFMLSAYLFKKEKVIASAAVASLAYWFRSELALMPLAFGLLTRRWWYVLFPLASIGLWFSITGQMGTTNNMAVVYISQFVFEDNPWKKTCDDGEAFKLAEAYGQPYAWRPEAQSTFLWRTLALIREEPLYFTHITMAKSLRAFLSRLFVAKEHFGGWIAAVLTSLLMIFLWFPVTQPKRLDALGVFVLTFALCQIPIAAFSGNTTITNATYLFLFGNAIKFYR